MASFIGLVGWLDSPDLINSTYDNWYRYARLTDSDSRTAVQEVISNVEQHTTRPVEVTFLGVFDTVGALGTDVLPDYEFFEALREHLENDLHTIQGFHDTELGPHIRNVYHALAIDENHEPFEPTLLGEVPVGTTAEEVWFAGGHGEVGGGHKDPDDNRTLAKVPLVWMMEKAVMVGLALNAGALDNLRNEADPLAPQHDAPPNVQHLASMLMRNRPRTIPDHATIHPAVEQRLNQMVETRGIDGVTVPKNPYRPLTSY